MEFIAAKPPAYEKNRTSRKRQQISFNKPAEELLLSQDDIKKLTGQLLSILNSVKNENQFGQLVISLLKEIGKRLKTEDLSTLGDIIDTLAQGRAKQLSLDRYTDDGAKEQQLQLAGNEYLVNGKPINTGWHIDISKTNGVITSLSSRSNSNTGLADDDEDDDEHLRLNSRSFNWPNKCIRVTSSHAKYISPHRKRSIEDRMTRAQEAREKILEDRANKFRDILKKVDEMRAWKEEDALHLRESVENKLLKAEIKRRQQIEKIIKKAHDEDSKVNEIQFINNLEAQNRRHEILNRKKEHEERIHDLFEERQRRLEEKLAKEAAAEERRKTIEAERRAKLQEIQQRRKIKDQKVERQQQVKEKERLEIANQKNRDREQKMSAIKAAYQAGVQTLKKKIKQKQEQSKRRHEINLKLIRQKAFELSIKRYNSFVNSQTEAQQVHSGQVSTQQLSVCGNNIIGVGGANNNNNNTNTNRRLQLKPFITKKICNICKEYICSESSLFTHLRSEQHHFAIKEHYGDTLMTTNEAIEIHNLKHIVDTDELITTINDSASGSPTRLSGGNDESYNHNGISIQANERESLLAIEKKSRRLRYKLLLAGKQYNREWLCQAIQEQMCQVDIKINNNTTTTTESTIKDKVNLTVHNVNCHHNKAQYVKINRIVRDLAQMNAGMSNGPMPTSVVRNIDRLLVEIIKQLTSRKIPTNPLLTSSNATGGVSQFMTQFEIYAIDTLVQYDIVSCLVSILRKIVPSNDLNFHIPPALPARTYIKIIQLVYGLCRDNADLCYVVFQSNQIVQLSDILSHRLGFIIGNDSPASSISGSSIAGSDAGLDGANLASTSAAQKLSDSSRPSSTKNNVKSQQRQHNLQASDNVPVMATNSNDDNQLSYSGSNNGNNNSNNSAKRCDSIVDDMTASLCRLLATITDTILETPLTLFPKLDKDAFHQRCNDFISYMVGVGIVDTESVIMSQIQSGHSDENNLPKVLNFTASCITFVSSLVKALIARLDTSTESLYAPCKQTLDKLEWRRQCVHLDNTQLLTTLKMTQISGVLTLIYELLVDSGSLRAHSKAANDCAQQSDNRDTQQQQQQQQNSLSLNSASNSSTPATDAANDDNNAAAAAAAAVVVAPFAPPGSGNDNSISDTADSMTNNNTIIMNNAQSAASSSNSSANSSANSNRLQQLSYDKLVIICLSLRLINYVAHIDLALMQAILEDEALSLQLRHVCNYLLWYCFNYQQQQQQQPALPVTVGAVGVHTTQAEHKQATGAGQKLQQNSPVQMYPESVNQQQQQQQQQQSSPSSKQLRDLQEELVDEIVLLLGNFTQFNATNQFTIASGQRPTIVEQLCSMPFEYFSRIKQKAILMPTLISGCYQNDHNSQLVKQELSLTILSNFIDEQILAAQLSTQASTQAAPASSSATNQQTTLYNKNLTNLPLNAKRWLFENRFPKDRWLSAKSYFQQQQQQQHLKQKA